ncbi:uncharacterized protein LOC124259815 [Haliotis rubra]|uniref:uncharacterized protein LOC124259815 n=1 Tax=Haliotis rubra TaxID=36100 RepID=UPI001EE5ADE3|nr:uncharacterized protein LOC124259815 [Haliotis rubra]
MNVVIIYISAVLSQISCFLLSTEKQPDTDAMSVVLNHVNQLEETVASLKNTTSQLQLELHETKVQLQDTQIKLQDEQASSAAEMASLKEQLKHLSENSVDLQTHDNLTGKHLITHDIKANTIQLSLLLNDVHMLNNRLSVLESTVNNQSCDSSKNTFALLQNILNQQTLDSLTDHLAKVLAQNTSKLLGLLKNDVNATSVQVNSITNDMRLVTMDIAKLLSDNSGREDQINGLLHDVSNITMQLRENTNTLRNGSFKTAVGDVSFQAVLANSGLLTDTVALAPFKFPHVLHDAGHAYSSSSGKFTAPVSGSYIFWTQLEMADTGSSMYLYIVRYSQTKSSKTTIGAGFVETDTDIADAVVSAQGVCHLEKGDTVWVVTSDSRKVFGSLDQPSSYFGGALLYSD